MWKLQDRFSTTIAAEELGALVKLRGSEKLSSISSISIISIISTVSVVSILSSQI